jgi:thymidylate kinase
LLTSVVVFGSLPPGARDLDLLVRAGEEAVVGSALEEAGLVGRGSKFAAFGACTAFGVELTAVTSWGIPRREAEALFADSIPLEGAERITRPAPAHALLILARRLALSHGRLADKLRPRIAAVLAEDPAAWANARERAAAWGLPDALRALEDVHRGADASVAAPGAVRTRARRRLAAVPRPRRPLVIALSGLDGAGKSSHAAALSDALGRLDVPAAVVWTPLGQNTTLELIGRPAKKLLSRLRFGPLRALAERTASGSVFSNPRVDESANGTHSAVTAAWATFVAVLNVLSQRRALARHALRARVVVYDRHALDSIVRMRFLYGASGNSRLQRWLVRRAAPHAVLAYYLEIAPETALARKADWTLDQLHAQARLYSDECDSFRARRVNAERPREEVCAEIAEEVWRALG